MIVGVDEAGKGPVLGSMFVAAVRAPPGALPEGIDDSKALAPARREALAAELGASDPIEVAVVEVPTDRIDDPETDMNTLTVDAQASALDRLAGDGDHAIVDAGDVNAERFARRVGERLDADVEVVAEHGADGAHEIVGAASVVAKVERDAHVAALAEDHGDVGSGYPSDPTTREFLGAFVEDHGRLPDCARSSWSTCDDVLSLAAQRSLEEF